MAKQGKKGDEGLEILEHGDLFFFYHPKLERERVDGLEDVAAFHLLMHPLNENLYRYAAISLKGLLESGGEGGWWARMELVESHLGPVQRKLLDTHPLPPARPCGEGVYALARHGRHTHLAYALELPETVGEVQKALGLAQQESPYLAIVNPFSEAREEADLSPQIQLPSYPPHLLHLFGDRRFHGADPVELLDYEGVEFLMARRPSIGVADLGMDLLPEHETRETAEVFSILKLRSDRFPLKPLFEGSWA